VSEGAQAHLLLYPYFKYHALELSSQPARKSLLTIGFRERDDPPITRQA
jgi:hypothetical protein